MPPGCFLTLITTTILFFFAQVASKDAIGIIVVFYWTTFLFDHNMTIDLLVGTKKKSRIYFHLAVIGYNYTRFAFLYYKSWSNTKLVLLSLTSWYRGPPNPCSHGTTAPGIRQFGRHWWVQFPVLTLLWEEMPKHWIHLGILSGEC